MSSPQAPRTLRPVLLLSGGHIHGHVHVLQYYSHLLCVWSVWHPGRKYGVQGSCLLVTLTVIGEILYLISRCARWKVYAKTQERKLKVMFKNCLASFG